MLKLLSKFLLFISVSMIGSCSSLKSEDNRSAPLYGTLESSWEPVESSSESSAE